jgi:hypothetical protein
VSAKCIVIDSELLTDVAISQSPAIYSKIVPEIIFYSEALVGDGVIMPQEADDK